MPKAKSPSDMCRNKKGDALLACRIRAIKYHYAQVKKAAAAEIHRRKHDRRTK